VIDSTVWDVGDVVQVSAQFESIRLWAETMDETVGWFTVGEIGFVVGIRDFYLQILTNTGKMGYVLDNMVVGVRCNS
jgi:hypothetical protein